MSHVYDNWEKLVAAVLKREQFWQLCHSDSLNFSSSSVSSDVSSSSSRRFSFDIPPDHLIGRTPEDGYFQLDAHIGSPSNHLDSGPKPPKTPSGWRIGKIAGAARQFFTPATIRRQSQMRKLPQDIIETGLQRASQASAPTKLKVHKAIHTIEVDPLSLVELKGKTDNFGRKALIGGASYGRLYRRYGKVEVDIASYGRVYFAQLDNGNDVAVRNIERFSDSNVKFLTQVSMLSRFKHENVVELVGYCVEDNYCILAYEFATKGSLHGILHGRTVKGVQRGPVLNWMQRVRIAVDAAKGLEYLHDKVQPSIIHRHIRSTNVLLFDGYKAKIADLSISDKAPDIDSTGACIHPNAYQHTNSCDAPEWNLTQKSDVYGFGVVLLELLTGRKAFEFDYSRPRGEEDIVDWAIPRLREDKVEQCVDPELNGRYPLKSVAKFAAVAASCVQFEPERRPDMHIVVKDLHSLLEEAKDMSIATIEVHPLSLKELKEKTDNFGPKAFIGEGSRGSLYRRYGDDMVQEDIDSYGRVYFAQLDSGKNIAVRKLDVSSECDSNVQFLYEVSMVSRFKHENMVELLGYYVENNLRILAYEFATMGSLHDILHGRVVKGVEPGPVLNWMQRVRIAVDAARGLEYFHDKVQRSIVHRHIRSTNVLLFEGYI